MKTEIIKVANLKCSGCANTISKELNELDGVVRTLVDVEDNSVTVVHEDIYRQIIIDRLHALGYPEATEKNGLLLQLKSYGSCMLGRIENL